MMDAGVAWLMELFAELHAPQRCGALSHDDDLAPLFTQAGTGTRTTTYNYWLRRYRATLKPKDFPDRAGPGRPLDNFELLKSALGMGRFRITRK